MKNQSQSELALKSLSVSRVEAFRKKSIGDNGERLGENALKIDDYDVIINLNNEKMNYPFADLYAEKNGKRFVISVKARNKNQKNGTLNGSYKLGRNAYAKAKRAEQEYGAEAYWMAVQFDRHTYSVYYGPLAELNGSNRIPVRSCMEGKVGKCLVKDAPHDLDFDFLSN